MIKNHHHYPVTSILFCVLVFLLPITKALSSVVLGILIVYVLVSYFDDSNKSIDKILLISFTLYFGLSLVSMLYTESVNSGWQKIGLKLPLLFIPFIYRSGAKHKGVWDLTFEQLYIWMAVIIAGLSAINYYNNKEALDFMVLQNKPIPVMSHIYHIEFSIILALALIICCYRLLFYYWRGSLFQWLYLIALVIGSYSLHIMSVRTGMLCFYVGTLVLLVSYIMKTRKYWILLAGVIGMGLIFTTGYIFSESFKNRILLTLDDINVLKTKRDRNWHSVSMRVDAFNNALSIVKEEPMLGVGIGDVDLEVQKSFIKRKTKLLPENRKKPHHQFIENAVQSGILSPVTLLFILLIPLFFKRYRSPLSITVMLVFLIAMQFESILERQSTVLVFVLLYAYVLKLRPLAIEKS